MPRAALPCLLLCLSAASHAQDPAIDLLVYPAGIFEISDGRLGGPGTTMLARLQTASGVRLNQQLMPVARAMQTVGLKPATCLVGLPRTPEREAQFRWAGPWASGNTVVYGRFDETRRVEGPQDLRNARIAVMRESRQAVWAKEQGLSSHEVNDVAVGLRMLQAGRVDFWLASEVSARHVIQTSGGPAPRALHSFWRVDLHIACNNDTPAATVERLQAGIDQLRRNGELAEFGVK